LSRAKIAAARDGWRAAQARMAELERALEVCENDIERAHYDWEQWESQERLEHTCELLDEARGAVRRARAELESELEDAGLLPDPTKGGGACGGTRART
jgi:chromosome segregation ATPase